MQARSQGQNFGSAPIHLTQERKLCYAWYGFYLILSTLLRVIASNIPTGKTIYTKKLGLTFPTWQSHLLIFVLD